MKGIILAGGHGTRLLPLTAITSKQLLPVYDRPLLFYPLNTLITAGVRDILIIVAPQYSGAYLNLLGSMLQPYGIRLSFVVQKEPRGIAEAFILAEDFLDGGPAALILGDNIFEDDFTESLQSFMSGARIFAKEVSDPERFGVVSLDAAGRPVSVVEKPTHPESHLAITGLYVYDGAASAAARTLIPSARGELEITDLHQRYLAEGKLDVCLVKGAYFDAGTHDALLEAGLFARDQKLSKRFHPLFQEAIAAFNVEFKQFVTHT